LGGIGIKMWNEENLPKLLSLYKEIQTEWGNACIEIRNRRKTEILCEKGCSDCCKGKDYFDRFTSERVFSIKIHGIEGTLIKKGFKNLPINKQKFIIENHHKRLHRNKECYLGQCVFLDENGHCIIYKVRPYTCRITGLPVKDKLENPEIIREEARKEGVLLTEIAEYYEYTCDKYKSNEKLNCDINSNEPWAKRWLAFLNKSRNDLIEIDAINKQIILVPISTFVINALL
jgi:Fe-S-cluster containining protein